MKAAECSSFFSLCLLQGLTAVSEASSGTETSLLRPLGDVGQSSLRCKAPGERAGFDNAARKLVSASTQAAVDPFPYLPRCTCLNENRVLLHVFMEHL